MYMLKIDLLRGAREVRYSSSWAVKWHVKVEWLIRDPDPLNPKSKYFFSYDIV